MTERDPFEDVLSQFRPVGPRPDMRFPVTSTEGGVQRQDQHRWGGWKAAALFAAVAAGVVGVWLQIDRRSDPQAIGDMPVVARTTRQESAGETSNPKAPRVTITGDAKRPIKLVTVSPAYTEETRAQHITGTVFLEIVIATDGSVSQAEVVRGVHPDLDEAAVAAVRRWKYLPTKVDDQSVEIVMVVDVTFKLD